MPASGDVRYAPRAPAESREKIAPDAMAFV